jgi:hypothetical protein
VKKPRQEVLRGVVLYRAGTWRRVAGLMLSSLVCQRKISTVEKHRTWFVCVLSCVEQFRFFYMETVERRVLHEQVSTVCLY